MAHRRRSRNPAAGFCGLIREKQKQLRRAVGNLFGGPSTPKMPDDVNYACVADVQITEQGTGSAAALVSTGAAQQAGVYQTRLAASVHQRR